MLSPSYIIQKEGISVNITEAYKEHIEYTFNAFTIKKSLYFLFIKAKLEQCGDKPPFYIVLGVLVDVSVFKGSNSDLLTVMP